MLRAGVTVTCPSCETSAPTDTEVGVGPCRACGAMVVWPQLEPELLDERKLRASARPAMARYFVMPWTLPALLGEPRREHGLVARACWMLEVTTPRQRTPDCASCRGTGAGTCPACDASGRSPCPECAGSTRVPGKRGTKRCPTCRGKGDRKCQACSKGAVACPDCFGTGRGPTVVDHHAHQEPRVMVDASFDADVYHPQLRAPQDFEHAAIHRDRLTNLDLLGDTGWRALDPSWSLSPGLIPPLRENERVQALRVQQLRARGVHLPLRTRWHEGELHFAGRPLQLATPDLGPVRRRAQLAAGAAGAVGLTGLALSLHYLLRSPWFGEYGHAGALALTALFAGALAGLTVLGVSLPRPRRWRWMAPLVGLGAAVLLGLGLWFSAAPSLAVAEEALAQDDLDRASLELDALVALGQGSTDEAALRGRVRARRGVLADDARARAVADSTSLDAAARALREDWHDPQRRGELLAQHLARASALTTRAWEDRDAEAMARAIEALDGLDLDLAATARALRQLLLIRLELDNARLEQALEGLDRVASLDSNPCGARFRPRTTRGPACG